jgi:hypothetical protein
MTDVVSYAPGFASPCIGDSSGIARALAGARLNETRRQIAGSVVEQGQHVASRAVLAFEPGDGNPWRPETGLALLAHRSGSYGLAALQLALACAGTGGSGAVECRLERADWLYLDGWLIAAQGRCGIRSDGRLISVYSDLGCAEYVVTGQNRWIPLKAPEGPWTAHASGGLAPRYVTISGMRHATEGFPWISAKPPLTPTDTVKSADSAIAVIHQAWQLILKQAPVFGLWIAGTAEGCLLLDHSGSEVAQSGSSFDHPGLIAIEPPACPIFCGEVLVHECSHQQLLIYTMIAPMVKPGSHEMHYSPIKRAKRPIGRVLTGAHAVGNMLLYYAALISTIKLDRASQERFGRHHKWFVEDYRPALDTSESLTDAGRVLWVSLVEAVDRAMPR